MRFLMLVLTLLLSACVGANINDHYAQTVSSWRFAKEKTLIRSWGQPTSIRSLPNGNKVFIYHRESYKDYPTASVASQAAAVSFQGGRSLSIVPNNQNMPNVTYLVECTTFFEIDPHEVIVDVRANGNNCAADEGFVLSRSNPEPRPLPRKP
ncbi:MAG TPA: hypothetical protein VLH77_02435 [Gammaproteobacteria bacterium]|nr:hypothetical protein [Gammaproteobacteria bacterium]